MKKILFIAYNGLTTEIQKYLSEIDNKVFDMAVVVPYHLNLYGIEIDFIDAQKTDKVKYIPFALKSPPYTFFPDPQDNKELDGVLKKLRPDLIIIQSELFHPNSTAVINSKLKNSPDSKILNFVATQYLPSQLDYFRNYFYYKKTIKYTNFLCCRNKKELKILRKNRLLRNIKIFQNYWGSSPGLFYKAYTSKNEIISNNASLKPLLKIVADENILLGFVGRIVEEKGLHLIIEALKRLPKNYYLVYSGQFGSGYYKNLIDTKIKKYELKDRCVYLGNINYKKLVYLYNALDLIVAPTNSGRINFIELFGRVIPEAMLCKILIIGSDNGSISEIINNSRLIFKQNDVDSLKGKILEVSKLDNSEKEEIIRINYNYALNNYISKLYIKRLQNFILKNI